MPESEIVSTKLESSDTVLPPVSPSRVKYHIYIYNTNGPNTLIAEVSGTNDPILWGVVRENAQRLINDLISTGEDVKIYDVQI